MNFFNHFKEGSQKVTICWRRGYRLMLFGVKTSSTPSPALNNDRSLSFRVRWRCFLFYSRAKKRPMREGKKETRNKIRHGKIAGFAHYWKFGRALNLSLWRHRQLKLKLTSWENVKLFIIHKSVVWVVFNCWLSFGFDVVRCLKGPNTWRIYSPDWNFSPVGRAEFLARFPEQIFLKRRLRLHEESFSPDLKFQPVLQTGLEISTRSNGLRNLM